LSLTATIPTLFSIDVSCEVRKGALQGLRIEKRNKEIGDEERLSGIRYVAIYLLTSTTSASN
jgi:hypothetical protein